MGLYSNGEHIDSSGRAIALGVNLDEFHLDKPPVVAGKVNDDVWPLLVDPNHCLVTPDDTPARSVTDPEHYERYSTRHLLTTGTLQATLWCTKPRLTSVNQVGTVERVLEHI